MNIGNVNLLILVGAFFAAVIVSYYTNYRLDQRYEFSPDRPRHFQRYKTLLILIIFLIIFIIGAVLAGI